MTPARSVGQGDHPVRLDVGVLLVGRVVGLLDDHDAAAHHRDRGLAPPDLPVGHDLARRPAPAPCRAWRRAARSRPRSRPGPGGAPRGSPRPRAPPPRPTCRTYCAGEDRPVGLDHRDEVLAGQVLGRDHGADAGNGAGLVGVEVGDARVGVRRAQHPADERPREGQVVDVEGGALDLVGSVGSPDPLPDAHASSWGWVSHAGRDRMNEAAPTHAMNEAAPTFKGGGPRALSEQAQVQVPLRLPAQVFGELGQLLRRLAEAQHRLVGVDVERVVLAELAQAPSPRRSGPAVPRPTCSSGRATAVRPRRAAA